MAEHTHEITQRNMRQMHSPQTRYDPSMVTLFFMMPEVENLVA